MSLFCSTCNALVAPKATQSWGTMLDFPLNGTGQSPILSFRCLSTKFLGRRVLDIENRRGVRWSFVGGSRVVLQPKVARIIKKSKGSSISASWITTSQIASNAFNLGTIAVLPFYALMVVAPNSRLAKRTMESNVPYVVLGVLYAYLLYLSWTPDHLRIMFGSKYLLPELPSTMSMFSSELTMASAWIHLVAVDLFAARQVFHDGLKNKIEIRHSVLLCMLFCPIGIAIHAITKKLTMPADQSH